MWTSYILTHVRFFFFCVLGLRTNQKKRLKAIWRKLRQRFIMGKRFLLASIEFTNSLFTRSKTSHQRFWSMIGWKSTLLTEARSIHNSGRWLRRCCSMILLRFVFGLRKVLNDYSVEQERVGATLRITTLFPKLQRFYHRKKLDETTLLWDTVTPK